ncbi:hypothetical protein Tfer_2742 [Thermincola ferriacetica]|uniref:Uncharacterized protein n=1 Tax=Thermincola ferriacetica TaxID=281456 RepID=A0A0L6VZL6_9FIRM|nr:hypothetical protein Tfer_2742 [Thermincola ferriacetica]
MRRNVEENIGKKIIICTMRRKKLLFLNTVKPICEMVLTCGFGEVKSC